MSKIGIFSAIFFYYLIMLNINAHTKPEDCITSFNEGKEALSNAKDDQLTRINRRNFLMEADKKFVKAINCFRDYSMKDSLIAAYTYAGETNWLLGRDIPQLKNEYFKKAIHYCDSAIQISNNFGKAFRIRGMIYSDLRNISSTITDLERAIDLNTFDDESLDSLSNAYLSKINQSISRDNFFEAARFINQWNRVLRRYSDIQKRNIIINIINIKKKELIRKLLDICIISGIRNEYRNFLIDFIPEDIRTISSIFDAIEQLREKKYDDAMSFLKEAERLKTTHYFDSSINYIIAEIEKAEGIDVHRIYLNAKISNEKEDYNKAIETLETVFKRDNSYVDSAFVLGEGAEPEHQFKLSKLYLDFKDIPEYLEYTLEVISADTNKLKIIRQEASFLLAVKLSRQDSTQNEAKKLFKKILDENPEFQVTYFMKEGDIWARYLFAEVLGEVTSEKFKQDKRLDLYEMRLKKGVAHCDSILNIDKDFYRASRLKESLIMFMKPYLDVVKKINLLENFILFLFISIIIIFVSFTTFWFCGIKQKIKRVKMIVQNTLVEPYREEISYEEFCNKLKFAGNDIKCNLELPDYMTVDSDERLNIYLDEVINYFKKLFSIYRYVNNIDEEQEIKFKFGRAEIDKNGFIMFQIDDYFKETKHYEFKIRKMWIKNELMLELNGGLQKTKKNNLKIYLSQQLNIGGCLLWLIKKMKLRKQ